ncbi:MAG: hypothetical protein JST73_01735 [Actinobacteria bacterium]|nr:hypothetical protein [Actinomycetota bacterium]
MAHHVVYGLDIETAWNAPTGRAPASDAYADGIVVSDPGTTPISRAVLSTRGSDLTFVGDEPTLLHDLDAALAGLAPGIIATWNGSGFALPYLADRAELCGIRLGLHLAADSRLRHRGDTIPGHDAAYRAAWYAHRHLDAAHLYRSGRRPLIDVEDLLHAFRRGSRSRGRVSTRRGEGVATDLSHDLEHAHAANDARLVRCMVEARLPGIERHVDRVTVPTAGTGAFPGFAEASRRPAVRAVPLSPAHPAVRAAYGLAEG